MIDLFNIDAVLKRFILQKNTDCSLADEEWFLAPHLPMAAEV